ncbi:hypothetical protein QFW77_16950 [Luteimonas sp. RD2P54]|uniref:Uncharacterized protein n=1 Tax=Luteimonas endophytica TaxID=3042023 RepID=A0ABT6JD07_9GAMM|nr:hypothetical protein [Luteimonas endophytica]MDH5824661.1 hypothetical protein [Luteimonas endophytica]
MRRWLCVALCCFAGAAVAEPAPDPQPKAGARACLVEGSFMHDGEVQPLVDCLQGNGESHARLAGACEGPVRMAEAVGAPPPRVTWLVACPAPAQARCEGIGGTRIVVHHYRRTPAQLAQSRPGCEGAGGAWVEGDGKD